MTPGDETLAVAWSAPDSDGGRDITSYDLRYIRSDAPSKADANWTVRDGIWSFRRPAAHSVRPDQRRGL